MRCFAACGLLLGACLTNCAFADTYAFTLTDTSNSDSLSFSLDSSAYTVDQYGRAIYSGLSGSTNGSGDTFDLYVSPDGTLGDYLDIYGDSGFGLNGYLRPEFLGIPNVGGAPVITPGTYGGQVLCEATLRSPFVHQSGLPGTMAFLQIANPFTYTCGDSLQLAVTGSTPVTPPPSSVTPEPASLGLFATGVLGVAGVIRRRVRF